MNKKVYIILAGVLSCIAVFLGLWFMGVISFALKDIPENDTEEQEEATEEDAFDLVFKGIKFTIDAEATALIHESNCLNIKLEDEYLIQIDIEDKTINDFWDDKESKVHNLIEAGYRIELEPELLTQGEREYIRYVVSVEQERGSAYDRSYFELLLSPADSGRRFFVSIRYDGIDVDKLEKNAQTQIYEEAFAVVDRIVCAANPTDEKDDEVGTGWLPDSSIDSKNEYLSHDSLEYADGALEVEYNLPEGCYLVSDNISGKTYRSEQEYVYINISTSDYTWQTAEEKADMQMLAGFSRIHTEGEIDINGKTFYYYTYSVMMCSKREKRYDYNFVAYCDMENGDIYCIHGYSYENEKAMDINFYADVMQISE